MRYTPLELGQPGNPECPDKYDDDSTILVPKCTRIILQISTQAVFVQFGIMPQGRGQGLGSVVWQAEEPYLPIALALARQYDALRVRNYLAGFKAQVLATFT